ncbi:MAG: 4-alpha-glucanotransferase [Pseudomonadota bacterium]
MHIEHPAAHAVATSGPLGAAEPHAITSHRRAGTCMHLTSLPGPHGIGEIGRDAHAFIDAMAEAGLSVWQFLPTGPTAYGDSPYQPLSAYAGNPMLIELRALVELGLLAEDDLRPMEGLPADTVDYGAAIGPKTALLNLAAKHFFGGAAPELRPEYEAFVGEYDAEWLHDYALFRTLKSLHDQRPWPEWDAPYRRREPAAMASVVQEHCEAIRAIKFAQFMFYRQWRALRAHAAKRGVLLFGDMPIYIALDCADAWAYKAMLRIDTDGVPTHVAGVPPDYFSEDGQLWGNPLYDWEHHAQQGYAWWIARLRHTMRMVDIVRIDHFRGFEAYWAVPFGADTARDGAWEPGPNDAVFDAMRDALGDIPIVAEDLGAITDAVDQLRLRQRMPGMSVLQFLVGEPGFDPSRIEVDSVCYTGTHDNDTTLGWFHGEGEDVRSREQVEHMQRATLNLAGGDAGSVHWSLADMAFESRACMAIVPMQDFLGLGSDARLNTPGKPGGNWRWRLQPGQFDAAMRDRIASLSQRTGR